MSPQIHAAIVDSLTQVTPKVYVARLQPIVPMQFIAGQYGSFIIDAKTRRNFSFATLPGGKSFEICADITPMGPGSVWLMNLKPGYEAKFLGPLGRFMVDFESPNKPVFIATGTGIAPIRSMIYDFIRKNSAKEVVLYFGLRYEEDIFWDDEFKNLIKRHAGFSYQLLLSQPNSDWKGKRGRVTDYVFVNDSLDKSDFYLCGSREMVREMTDRLLASHIEELQIKTELFY